MENQNNAAVSVVPLSLPKGNGTIAGMGEMLSGIGPDGMLSLSLPLPVSAGRGDAPTLSLNYNSSSGNGPFGMGWSCPVMSVARRTARGVPRWQDDDEFTGPDGEVLLPVGEPVTRTELRGQTLPECRVTRYRPRIERTQFLIERWVPVQAPAESFWVVYTPDGGLYCLGKTAQARITHPQVVGGTAVWLLEECINALGEHQYWQYKAEDNEGCDTQELTPHPQSAAQRYLSRVFYGNIVASDIPLVLTRTPVMADWLFCLAFDYGEYGNGDTLAFEPAGQWAVRQDCFSDYRYGFDLRTRRLCRQVLMFHRLKALAGEAEGTPEMTLCGRMSLSYDESAVVTTLVSATRHATGSGAPASLPPLEFDWQEPMPATPAVWSQLTDLANLNHLQPWQLVDLYGEGIPGVLYQDKQAWWYCAPVRKTGGGVTWSVPGPLSVSPVPAEHAVLMDMTGDGRPDWVVTRPGVQGYFTLDADNRWSSFIPLTALPTEFFHPSARLQDLTGNGNPDLVLVGPCSVRLWGGNDAGWETAHDVLYTGQSPLPAVGHDARTAVVFSDLLGSGQQHLAMIRSDNVTVWPSLGNGQFGEAQVIPGFSVPEAQFNPSRVYLADTDGSGSTDILYVQTDRIRIFRNQNGNRFVEASPVMLPDGVRVDDTCQIQVADLQGLGVASVLLTVPYPQVQHWCCHLNTVKPWLLSAMNNNMGTHHTFTWRSSAQFWLDEKQKDPDAVCHLPFPVHTLWKQTTEDEITGNKISTEARYCQGVWDAREREMRGFACVEQQDTTLSSFAETDTPPLLTRSWYATGVEEVDSHLSSQFWQGDAGMFTSCAPHMTAWQNNGDQPLPDTDDRWWLQRAFRGCLLRSEVYGLDDSPRKAIPFSVSESRWQARRLSDHSVAVPVVMPLQLESRSYQYERIAADPLISQTVNLQTDAEGIPVDVLTIHYPRRKSVAATDYPSTLKPASIVADSMDEQQQTIYFTRNRARVFSFRKGDIWRVGLPDKQRTDVCWLPATECPDIGFSLENLTADGGVMSTPEAKGDIDTWFESGTWTFSGMQQVHYTTSQGEVPLTGEPGGQALVAFTESARLDKSVFSLTSAYPITETMLMQWGYVKMVDATTADSKAPWVVWGTRTGYTDYGDAVQFWRPLARRASLLMGKTQTGWDTHFCFPVRQTDAAGLTTTVQMDYRYMSAVQMTDINDNQHQVVLDDFGRPVASRFSGTENGQPAGYSVWSSHLFPLNISVADALAITAKVPLASFSIIVTDSWMPDISIAPAETLTTELRSSLTACGALWQGDRLCTMAWQRYLRRHPADADVKGLNTWLGSQYARLPPHQLDVVTDRYDTDSEQQQRQTIRFSDGMGRLLQTSVRHENGIPEWLWQQEGLTKNSGTIPTTCWAVSGRTEYNNKGLPVRTYQPFFLNDWRYVSDDSARQDLYADTLFYDAMGRQISTRTASGNMRRTGYYPWFTVSEDENDTAEEVSLPVN
ncbi:SpvB/TcaC N-terminal domain-containing protein [Enterobacter roggenkampii]|uniref:SpvB/TcaC N-terminal domain-containing protein n=1 Tax=Enterobacter roggenkampii TaxID=1812935 RepID=UPI002DB60BC7|nr:SpvB/TcaC N-terminal domain-containing protein [Enterobacter roggenkampii]MEB5890015.1 virulence protein [Enterobacter roggenkampii]